eukprot:TRINITY_DN20118_c0_g1_i1.p1 TRINITY_DN20118_c0_g1~~TRINITY_DN20118_c0_g1_i1.p1  ORF type:complete len:115 (-),score=12.33 TRINITY_DN20118_c0_g1_i1:915-1259(-)
MQITVKRELSLSLSLSLLGCTKHSQGDVTLPPFILRRTKDSHGNVYGTHPLHPLLFFLIYTPQMSNLLSQKGASSSQEALLGRISVRTSQVPLISKLSISMSMGFLFSFYKVLC